MRSGKTPRKRKPNYEQNSAELNPSIGRGVCGEVCYGEEALAKREAAVWLQPGSLTLEYGGQAFSVYDVELASETGKPTAVRSARLFETTYQRNSPQLRLFALEEAGWLTALKLEEYVPRRSSDPMALQEVLFPYLDAL